MTLSSRTNGVAADTQAAALYPAFCHGASPTFNKWVKLTALDIRALRKESGFEGQDIYFHLNHPIRFVYICGPVIAITFPTNTSNFVLLSIDDGSGITIEVKIERKQPQRSNNHARVTASKPSDTRAIARSGTSEKEWHKQHVWELSHSALDALNPNPVESPTAVANITILSRCADKTCYEPHIKINGVLVDIGTVLKAKGTLKDFNASRQVVLKRADIAADSAEEVRIWREYAQFAEAVLSKPWRLSDAEFRQLDEADRNASREQREEEKRKREKEERRARHEKHRQRKRARLEQQREQQREQQSLDEARELDGNALDRQQVDV